MANVKKKPTKILQNMTLFGKDVSFLEIKFIPLALNHYTCILDYDRFL